MPGQINKVHGIHLLGNHLFAPCAHGTKVDVQIANHNEMRTRGADAPGIVNIHQCFQVGGGNVTPNNKKSDVAYH
jgi:hypothetical protein